MGLSITHQYKLFYPDCCKINILLVILFGGERNSFYKGIGIQKITSGISLKKFWEIQGLETEEKEYQKLRKCGNEKKTKNYQSVLTISVLKLCPYAGNIKRNGFSFGSHDHLHPGNQIQHKAITDLYIRNCQQSFVFQL